MTVDPRDFGVPPYQSKVVEPIPFLTAAQRRSALERAHYNPFNLRSSEITIDLLSDSGTGATSTHQEATSWSSGDERYAQSRAWTPFHDELRDLTGYPHILPVHQGRAAERVLFPVLLGPGRISVSNCHFDTTHANVELTGALAVDLPCAQAWDLGSQEPFKGDIDLRALRELLDGPDGPRVGCVVMTITSNGMGGQPVSMANLAGTAELCHAHGVPMLLDAARFAENAWLVGQREPGYAGLSPREIAQRAFRLADGMMISLKKDGLVNIGGAIGLRDPDLHARCETHVLAGEGFSTYGGLSGREQARVAPGLREVVDADYLRSRAADTARLTELINDAGVHTVRPAGLHAVYLDAGRLLPHLPQTRFPGHALAMQCYLDGGIRCSELGSLYLGKLNDRLELTTPAPFEQVRLAVPRRVYGRAHLDYVAAVIADIAKDPERVPGFRIVSAPEILRPFKVQMAPVTAA